MKLSALPRTTPSATGSKPAPQFPPRLEYLHLGAFAFVVEIDAGAREVMAFLPTFVKAPGPACLGAR